MGNSSGKPIVFSDQVNLNHFRLLRVVGRGAFGKVRIVERKDTGLTFALKYIRKDEVVRSESVRNIIRERRMLEQLNHPFLCNLRYSFQDMEYLYLVVDLMNGGDLRFHITRKTFTEEAIRYWMAELACALVYIHSRRIVHRDVKPDNILLDSDGHVHLADFNVASELHSDRPLTSKSGTLAYLAPEIYSGAGYGTGVDWWSLGVVFYECVYGRRPFSADTHENLGKDIMRASPKWPVTNPPVTSKCQNAIQQLLTSDVSKRIGAAGFSTFTAHPFFADLDFEALERKEIQPVFIPSSEKTNFDATYDLEELLLEEAPLEARARKQKPRERLKDDATAQEIRRDELHKMIETLFEPFDYTAILITGSAEPDSGTPSDGQERPGSNDTKSDAQSKTSANSLDAAQRSGKSTPSSTIEFRNIADEFIKSNSAGKRPLPSPSVSSASGSVGSRHGNKGMKAESGVRMVLDEGRDGLVDKITTTIPPKGKPSGMLGFLSKRKGRSHSPKPQERGVLGREGARVVVR